MLMLSLYKNNCLSNETVQMSRGAIGPAISRGATAPAILALLRVGRAVSGVYT